MAPEGDDGGAGERARHREFPTVLLRVQELERIIMQDMQLDKLGENERRAFPYAYRTLLRGQLDAGEETTRHSVRDARYWTLVGTLAGTILGVGLDVLARIVLK